MSLVSALVVVLAMMVGLPASALAAGGTDHRKVWVPPNTPLGRDSEAVKGGTLKVRPLDKPPAYPVPHDWAPDNTPVAQAGSATLTLGADSAEARAARAASGGASPASGGGALVQAGQLPVALAPKDATAGSRSVKVQVTDAAAGKAVGVDGPLIALTGVSDASSDDLKVALDLKALQGKGLAADRAQLVALPACALTTPDVAECRKQTPIAASADVSAGQLTADVALPAASTTAGASATKPTGGIVQSSFTTSAVQASDTAAAPMVLAAVSGASGSAGSYKATSLSPSMAWTSGSNVGNFTYSYPIQTPAGLGALAPKVALVYDSSAVDGKTSATNAQASWIGDGWDYQPGFIERSYKGCDKDGITGSGDLCWGGQNAVLNLSGHTGTLVRDDSTGAWHLQGDDGSKVEQLTGAPNGLPTGEYWRVTTSDGTQYYFGQNHLPGGDGSDPATNSAWSEPVYSPNNGDPCYNSGSGQGSWCTMGWRWNLDYVVDTHQNLITYGYATETNSYSRGGGQNNGNGTLTSYTRGGYLKQIAYGQRLPDQVAAKGTLNPAAQVVFTTSERCLPSGGITCSDAQRTTANATSWPDVPLDQACDGSSTCTNYSPTFFTTKRLTGISTVVFVNSTPVTVDSWALTQSFPDPGDGTKPALWLASIARTGSDGQSGVTLPAVSFTARELSNRVDGLVPAAPMFNRPRIQQITTETGGQIGIVYSDPACSRVRNVMPASEDGNTLPCIPVKWYLPGSTSPDPVNDWFNKPLVTDVTEQDAITGAGMLKDTHYTYNGDAAWHRNDSEFTDPKTRTWDSFRGYQSVTTTTGSAYPGEAPKTQTTVTFLRGMDGDYRADGTARSIQVPNPLGGPAVTDSDWLAGNKLATQTFDQAGGNVVAMSGSTTNGQQTTATHKQSGNMPDLVARYPASQATATSMAKLANGSWRTTTTVTTTDPAHANRITQIDDQGDGTQAAPEICTSVNYASGSNPMLLTAASEKKAVTGPCGTQATAANTTSDARTLYDGKPFGQLGDPGDVTSTQVLDHYDGGGNPVYVNAGSLGSDAYGRPLTSIATDGSTYDGSGNQLTAPTVSTPATTRTAYTPATGAAPTSVSVTGPLGSGWTTTTAQDPGRGLPLTSTDENGRTTTEQYDGLGRLTAVWVPGRSPGSDPDPNEKFSYALNGTTGPSFVMTQSLNEAGGGYASKTELYDGLGRLRQTQSTTPARQAGRLITDTAYDSHGWPIKTSNPYYDPSSLPSGSIFSAQGDSQIPAQTWASYDGQGRVVRSEFRSYAKLQWATSTAYPGADRTDVTPPSGGTPTSTVTDARGRTSALWQYHAASPTGSAGDADITSYTYTPVGQPAARTDAAGNTWTYQYDLRGRQTSATDPDTGTTQTFYDVNSRIDHTTDARGSTLAYTYDLLGRKTGMYNGSVNPANQLASWTFDTLAKGQPTSATRYVGGASGAAYTQAVTGYDTLYHSLGSSTTIPSAEGALAGTYTTSYSYTPILGTLSTVSYPALGGLPAETTGNSYTYTGLLTGSMSRGQTIVGDMQYDALARPVRTTVGDPGLQVVSTQQYDWATGHVISSYVDKELGTTSVDQTSYTYNPAGAITSVTDLQDASASDQQCFTYDYLGRLSNAWTDTGGTHTTADWTDSSGTKHGTGSSDTVPGIGSCNNASGPAVNAGRPSVGGPAPYWQSYSYDRTGNRTKLVQHDVTGDLNKDLTTAQTFPSPGTVNNGSGGPHTLQTSQRSTSAGTSAASSDTYDKAGNTTQVSNPVGDFVLPTGTTLMPGQSVSSNAATLMMQTDGNLVLTSKRTGNVLWADNNSYGHQGAWATMQPDGNFVVYDTNHNALWASGTNGNAGAYLVLQDDSNLVLYSSGVKRALWNSNTYNTADANSGATLSWDVEDKLASINQGGSTTSYLYDADGNQLIRRDPGKTTINLGADELTLNTANGSLSDVRTLAAPGGLTLTRVTAAIGGGTLLIQATDPHGTANVQINTDANQSVAHRPTDPFGNPRGKLTPTDNWAGDKGFVGGTLDTATELTNLGAREYQPSTGRFLNPDPLFDPADPQQWNGYAYSNNDPVDYEDPTGLKVWDPDSGTEGATGAQLEANISKKAEAAENPVYQERAFHNWAKNIQDQAKQDQQNYTKKHCSGLGRTRYCYSKQDEDQKAAERDQLGKLLADMTVVIPAYKCMAGGGDGGKNQEDCDTIGAFMSMPEAGQFLRDFSEMKALDKSIAEACEHSFVAGTLVLMADGSRRKIEDVKVGDEIANTQPGDPGLQNHRVDEVHRTTTDVDFTTLTISTADGLKNISSTSNHPYYDVTTRAWQNAGTVKPGDRLQTPDGTVVVFGTRSYVQPQVTYDLTVHGVHTYYVLAGNTPVLVHNSNCGSFMQMYEGGGGVIADLNNGALSMAVERGGSSVSGGQMFADVMNHFGPENVTSFQAKWVSAMPSNLDAFNANLRAGMSYEDAAANTFTGHMAGKYGMTAVTVDRSKLVGEFGNYTNVEPVFSRPVG
ncbi:RHS repeat-associated core domain-containing protein [Kitasatospora kifunensis]|uniref:RHS repeat-associated protein n=1 Tax=Kitasatospora kifunensis TaxID=58351 RepID=A0A7W7QZK8_KITKI|nr:RHS repeat-associated core domain-containing protein [Kitasatospora kifunensis]MBB4922720.1 RHS repeat-associated protein [Kitasatospora kifunensis]